jgi:hypothetical protein
MTVHPHNQWRDGGRRTPMYTEKQPPSLSSIVSAFRDYASYHLSKLWVIDDTRLLAVGGVCVVALLLWFKGSSSSNDASNIERVLAEDSKTAPGATSDMEVVTRMRAINLNGCPQDFSAAYLTHIHAWEKLTDVEREAVALDQRYNSNSALLESFLRGIVFDFGMVGEASAAQQRLQSNYNSTSGEIRSSYQKIEQIALSYGASLKKNAH